MGRAENDSFDGRIGENIVEIACEAQAVLRREVGPGRIGLHGHDDVQVLRAGKGTDDVLAPPAKAGNGGANHALISPSAVLRGDWPMFPGRLPQRRSTVDHESHRRPPSIASVLKSYPTA